MGRLRIIAGSLKGRRIQVPHGLSIRPTADRVREALFSILGSAVVEAEILDAYAGSGALGFEALSRGAARVVFLEGDRQVAEALSAAAGDLGVATRCSVLVGPVSRSVRNGRAGGPFDLILADPPYADGEEAEKFLSRAAGVLRRGGRLVLERPVSSETFVCPGLQVARSARYGRCRLDFYLPRGPAGEGSETDGSSGESVAGERGSGDAS